MKKTLLDSFDLVNDIRLHVLLNYFLTVSWLLYAMHASAEGAVEFALVVTFLAGFAYLLNRYTDYHYDLVVDRGLKKFQRSTYLYLSFFFLFLSLLAFYYSSLPILSFSLAGTGLVIGILFGYVYSVRTFLPKPLKNYFIVKNLISTAAKSVAFIIGAVLLTLADLGTLAVVLISVFSVHLIYELLWDIRDINSDSVGNVDTVPTRFGKRVTLIACLGIWSASIIAMSLLSDPNERFFIKYLLILMFILLTFIISRPRFFHLMIYGHLVLNLFFVNEEVLLYLQGFILG